MTRFATSTLLALHCFIASCAKKEPQPIYPIGVTPSQDTVSVSESKEEREGLDGLNTPHGDDIDNWVHKPRRLLHEKQLVFYRRINRAISLKLKRRKVSPERDFQPSHLEIPSTFYLIPIAFDFRSSLREFHGEKRREVYEQLLKYLNYGSRDAMQYSSFLLCYLDLVNLYDQRLLKRLDRLMNSDRLPIVNNALYIYIKLKRRKTESFYSKVLNINSSTIVQLNALIKKHKNIVEIGESPASFNIGGPQFFQRVSPEEKHGIIDKYFYYKSILHITKKYLGD